MNKSMRLLKLAERLRSGRKFTVRELAETFEVSYRTMLRDLQDVAAMGVPLYSENGVHGGYRVLLSPREEEQARAFCSTIEAQAFHAVGFELRMPIPPSGEAQLLIPRLWMELERRAHEIDRIANRKKRTSVIMHGPDEAIVHVCYEVEEPSPVPEGMVGLSVPAYRCVIYPHRGSMDKANRTRTGERASAWIADAGIAIDDTLSMEWYDDSRFDPHSPANEFHFLRVIRSTDKLSARDTVRVWR